MFVELLGRSNFSFLRGASHPEEMVSTAHELGLSALGLCDRDGLYGSARAYVRAIELGQRIIVGAELSLNLLPREQLLARRHRTSAPRPDDVPLLCLMVETQQGYSNLCRLLTLAHADMPKGEGALELQWLAEHAAGLTAILPAPEVVGDGTTPPDPAIEQVARIFGERAALGVFRQLGPHDASRVDWVTSRASTFKLPVVATSRPLFHRPSRKALADVVHCIRRGTTLDAAGAALSANAEAYLRDEAGMLRLFQDHPEWVHQSGELAENLRFELGELRYHFPCQLEDGETADGKLARLTWCGADRRYPEGVPDSVRVQVEKELKLIAKLEVAPYFLSTWEVVEMARARRILCQGRGSAANSAVCYVLGITAVDPARSNLLFERFLSEERSEPPDIDIDFEHERREEVIQDIYERHGRERAAMVSEVICYRGKSALRETGKAFGLSLEQVDRLSGTITHWDSSEVSDQRLAEYGFDVRDPRLRKSLMLARVLEGFPRHLSIHVGGFVLSAKPLFEVAPIEPARMAGRTVIPWDKDDLEALGFFKIDVLGLGMLTAIRKCLELIHAEGRLPAPGTETGDTQEPFDPLEVVTRIPAEDSGVYEMVSRADTVGVFQIESRAQQSMLPRLRPERFYDLVIEVAIVRPGPIQGGMVHPYLCRRNGEEPITVPHEDLWPILERTAGVPLFQEQVMQISIAGAGYTGGQADQLRRDMAAWKKHGRLLDHRERLLEGFRRKGICRKFGEALFEQIKGFGDYGFPESHAASFALLVYASSWQKRYYPAHFTCALLNSQPMGFYSASSLVQDAQKHGVEVRDVSVVQSSWDSTLEPVAAEGKALRLGLRQVKGLGKQTSELIVSARAERPIESLDDLVRRVRLQKNELEALAEAGALEALEPGRRSALWKARAPRVGGLFEGKSVDRVPVELPPLRASEQLLLDYGRKGLSVDDHPLRHLRAALKPRGVIAASQLQDVKQGSRVRVAGLVLSRQQPGTASGVVFVTLEDETGTANLIVYQRVFERFRQVARHSQVLLAQGKVERHITPAREGSTSPASNKPSVPIVHLVVEGLERLDRPGALNTRSRDFH